MSETPRFGTMLRHARLARGLTQEALAERARVGARTISDLERGVATQPRLETGTLLADALTLAGPARAAFLAAARATPTRADNGGWEAGLASSAPAPLVGREREMAMLDRFLARGAGEPSLLLLAGEPGIGKTRLLHAAARQASAQGWTVLAGGCHRRGGQDPYSPVLDAVARYLFALSRERLGGALRGCEWLGCLLPELAPVLDPPPAALPGPEHERRLLFGALARLLANIAGPAGTLLVLDDLQWAGSDALDLMTALIRSPSSAPPAWVEESAARTPRVVGAYRDTEVGPADLLGQLLADLARPGLARQYEIAPLRADDAAALLAALLADGDAPNAIDPTLAPRVLERAGGTPLYLVSYAQALRAGGEQRPDSAAVERAPADVAQVIRRRLAILSAQARGLLDGAAIVGRRVPWPLLAPVVGQTEEEALHSLEEACKARLLREDEGGTYAFAHDLIREVVEAELGAARRAVLHRKVADALPATTAAPELLAYHYARGTTPAQAAPYLEQAGDQAVAQRAYGAAESRYREALDLLEHGTDAHGVTRVREKLAQILKETGRYDAALGILEPIVETHLTAEDRASLGRVILVRSELHALSGTADEGIARLRPLLNRVEREEPSPVHAPLYLSLGILLCSSGRYAEGILANERAVDLARALGDDRLLVKSTWLRADALQVLGYLEDALAADEAVIPLAETVGDLECLMAVPRDMAYIHAMRGDIVAAKGCIDRALALAVQLDNPAQCAFSQAVRGWLATLAGDTAQAYADLDKARAFQDQAGRSWHSAYPPIFQAAVSLMVGAWTAARAAALEAMALAEASGDLQALRWASCIVAELDILEGMPAAAEARLLPLRDRPGLRECDVTRFLPVLAWALLDLDRVAEAAAVIEQALARTRPEQMRLVLVEALRVRAMLDLRREQWQDAARNLAEALDLARNMDLPFAAARLLYLKGRLCVNRGEAVEASAHYGAAAALFARLSVPPEKHASAESHASTRPSTVPGPAAESRTRPERQAWALARMRVDGPLSPRVYAAALGVSADTALRDLRELAQRGAIIVRGTTKDRLYTLPDSAG